MQPGDIRDRRLVLVDPDADGPQPGKGARQALRLHPQPSCDQRLVIRKRYRAGSLIHRTQFQEELHHPLRRGLRRQTLDLGDEAVKMLVGRREHCQADFRPRFHHLQQQSRTDPQEAAVRCRFRGDRIDIAAERRRLAETLPPRRHVNHRLRPARGDAEQLDPSVEHDKDAVRVFPLRKNGLAAFKAAHARLGQQVVRNIVRRGGEQDGIHGHPAVAFTQCRNSTRHRSPFLPIEAASRRGAKSFWHR